MKSYQTKGISLVHLDSHIFDLIVLKDPNCLILFCFAVQYANCSIN